LATIVASIFATPSPKGEGRGEAFAPKSKLFAIPKNLGKGSYGKRAYGPSTTAQLTEAGRMPLPYKLARLDAVLAVGQIMRQTVFLCLLWQKKTAQPHFSPYWLKPAHCP
jgi:hypothetical protein